MLNILQEIERNILEILRDSQWNTMFIDYHDPHVERLWTKVGDHRLFLHKIYPSKSKSDALLHPHPWPSVIRILKGEYEMGIGHSETNDYPEIDCELILGKDSIYRMENPDGWHYVNPIITPVYSLMVTGRLYGRKVPLKPEKPFRVLTFSEKIDIINVVREYYD